MLALITDQNMMHIIATTYTVLREYRKLKIEKNRTLHFALYQVFDERTQCFYNYYIEL